MRHKRPPTVETMEKIQDSELWIEANLDCPFFPDEDLVDKARSKEGAHPDDMLDIPGINVKACLEGSKWKYFGRLVKFKGENFRWGERIVREEVVVLNTQDRETLWLGTAEQYEQMWCVD